jgi:hypothetical protein
MKSILVQISIRLRDDAVRELQKEIGRLERKIAEHRNMDDERIVGYFFPFDTEVSPNGVYDCRSGTSIGQAHEVAGMLADFTGKPVSFRHNDVVRVEHPRRAS